MELIESFSYQTAICKFWKSENAFDKLLNNESFIEIITTNDNRKISNNLTENHRLWNKMGFICYCHSRYESIKKSNNGMLSHIVSDEFQKYFDLLDGFYGAHMDFNNIVSPVIHLWSNKAKLISSFPKQFQSIIGLKDVNNILIYDNYGREECSITFFSSNGESTQLITTSYDSASFLDIFAFRVGSYYSIYKKDITSNTNIFSNM